MFVVEAAVVAVEDDDCWLGKIQKQLVLILGCELLQQRQQQQQPELHAGSERLELLRCGRLAFLSQLT